MAITGEIATRAQSELPETWAELAKSPAYGEDLLMTQVNAIMSQLFGAILSEAEQEALSDMVLDYAGKMIALRLINPGMDFYSKQPTSRSAGTTEQKGWSDRATYFKELRKQLLQETRQLWLEVEVLLPNRLVRRDVSVPSVIDGPGFMTADPENFEPAFGARTDPTPWRPV